MICTIKFGYMYDYGGRGGEIVVAASPIKASAKEIEQFDATSRNFLRSVCIYGNG